MDTRSPKEIHDPTKSLFKLLNTENISNAQCNEALSQSQLQSKPT